MHSWARQPTRWFREDNNARNGSVEKAHWKAKTKMGERHRRYIRYDGNSKQSTEGQASMPQRHLGSDVMERTCSQKTKKILVMSYIA